MSSLKIKKWNHSQKAIRSKKTNNHYVSKNNGNLLLTLIYY